MGLLGIVKKTLKIVGVAAPVVAATAVAKNPDAILQLKEKFEGLDLFASSDEQDNPLKGNANVGALYDAIRTDCLKNGIVADDKMVEEIVNVSEEVMNKRFENLSEQEKILVKEAYIQAKKQMTELIESGQISPNASSKELLQEFWKQFASIRYAGMAQDEMMSVLAESNKEFHSDVFKRMDEMGKIRYISDQQVKQADDYSAEVEKIKHLPNAQQAKALEKLNLKRRAKSKIDITNIAATQSSEVALHSIKLGTSSELSENMQMILRTRSSQTERTRTADLANFGFTKDLIKSYKAVGDSVQPSSLRDYTETVVGAKSAEGVTAYQDEYVADRNAYNDAKAKQAKGEALTPEQEELIAIMDETLYTVTAQGIGAGAMVNTNMTDAQKAEFYAKWDYDAQQFGDYETVVGYVNSRIASDSSLYAACQNAKQNFEAQMVQQNGINTNNVTGNALRNVPEIKSSVAVTSPQEQAKKDSEKQYSEKQDAAATTKEVENKTASVSAPTPVTKTVSTPTELTSPVKAHQAPKGKVSTSATVKPNGNNTTSVRNAGKNASDLEIQKALDEKGARFEDIYSQYGDAVLAVVFNNMSKYAKYVEIAVNLFESMVPEAKKSMLLSVEQSALPKLIAKCPNEDFSELIDEEHLTYDYKYLIEKNERAAR